MYKKQVKDATEESTTTANTTEETAGTKAAETVKEKKKEVKVHVKIANLDYDKIHNDAALLDSFVKTCKKTLATQTGVEESSVEVHLKKGSVIVHGKITVPDESHADAVQAAAGQKTLSDGLQTELTKVSGVTSALSSGTRGMVDGGLLVSSIVGGLIN